MRFVNQQEKSKDELNLRLCLKEKGFVFKEICGQRGKFCVDMNLSLRENVEKKGLCIKWVYFKY